MPEPSLGELTSAGNAQQAIPTIAVNDQQNMVRTLNQQAQFKAQNDWNKYQSFLKERADTLSNLAEIQKQEVMTEDRGEIVQDAAKMYEEILKNPGSFAGKDPQKYAEIQAMYGGLLSKATQSKQDNYFDKENRKYIAVNNELNTDDNKGIIETFRTQPLGSRKPYTLNLPTVLDIDAYTKGIMESPSVKTDYATSEVTPDNQFMIEKSGTKYDKKNFMDRWVGGLNVKTDKYGHSISGYVQQQYKKLPDEVKEKIPGKDDNEKMTNFWKIQGEKMFGSDQDIVNEKKEDRKPNTNFQKAETLDQTKKRDANTERHQKVMEQIGWYNAKSARERAKKDKELESKTDVPGNALNDIELPEDIKEGDYDMGGKGNKQRLANIQKLLGTIKNKAGKEVPVLSNEDINSNKKDKAISYRVQKIDGKPVVTEIQVGNKWYDRAYFRNAQLTADKEPAKGEKTSYKAEQSVKGGAKKSEPPPDPSGYKKEGKYWRYKDGSLYDDNGNIVKE